MAESILKNKSYQFAVQLVKLAQTLQNDRKEYVLSKQILRSGTAVGAIIREGEFVQSKPDFINKMSQALKEANETDYWLDLLFETDYGHIFGYLDIRSVSAKIFFSRFSISFSIMYLT